MVLIVVENLKHWPLDIPGTELVTARDYLTDPRFVDLKRVKVFNLCRTYGYQSNGYYVSLLAAARGHRPLPSVTTIQDLRASTLVRIVSEDVEELLQKALAPLKGDRFELSIYFGRNMTKRYDRLAQALFNHYPAPFLRADFIHADQWRLHAIRPIASSDIPEAHHEFVIERAQRFLARPKLEGLRTARYDVGILYDPKEVDSPSDERAIHKMMKAADKLGMRAWTLNKDELGRLGELDGLLIRETTSVNHHTYRFASRAEAEGLVVIDDPESIVRCSNKVYQAELFDRNDIGCPKTLIVHKDNAATVGKALGFPVVLKQPDSAFSAGVVKAKDERELADYLERFFDTSELVVAQAWAPSEHDWRVGVLDRKPLFVCRYHMAKGHWQIQKAEGATKRRYGQVEAVRVEDAPRAVVELGVKAAGLIGRGLYGVDLKVVDGKVMVIEINDNPNINAGYEDVLLKDELYLTLMQSFYDRIEHRGDHRHHREGRHA